eukprot:Hpha_TRINITY_DN15377_c2_g6::TRINITY_DN15377_c2_g6_i2::g.88482::m.88482
MYIQGREDSSDGEFDLFNPPDVLGRPSRGPVFEWRIPSPVRPPPQPPVDSQVEAKDQERNGTEQQRENPDEEDVAAIATLKRKREAGGGKARNDKKFGGKGGRWAVHKRQASSRFETMVWLMRDALRLHLHPVPQTVQKEDVMAAVAAAISEYGRDPMTAVAHVSRPVQAKDYCFVEFSSPDTATFVLDICPTITMPHGRVTFCRPARWSPSSLDSAPPPIVQKAERECPHRLHVSGLEGLGIANNTGAMVQLFSETVKGKVMVLWTWPLE